MQKQRRQAKSAKAPHDDLSSFLGTTATGAHTPTRTFGTKLGLTGKLRYIVHAIPSFSNSEFYKSSEQR
jgi:hypothetical protein